MTWPTWGELGALLVALGGSWGWLSSRMNRSKRIKELEQDLATAMSEAEKTTRAHTEALQAKDAEITEWKRQVERRDDRIDGLEDRLYSRG